MLVLLNVSSSGPDESLETAQNCSAGVTHDILGHVVPLLPDGSLQIGNTAVLLSTNLPLQNGLYGKVHNIQVWRRRWPKLFLPEALKMALAPLLDPLSSVGGCTVLLEDIPMFPVLSFHPWEHLITQHGQVHVLVDLDTLRDEDNGGFLATGGHAHPDHDKC